MSKITKLESQKNNKNRVNIFIDDEFATGCFIDLVSKYSLHKGKEISISSLKELIKEDEFICLRSKIFMYTERSFKTELEARRKLIEQGANEKEIEDLILLLKEYRYVDDDTYIDSFVKSKIGMWSIKKIEYKLIEKGIEKEKIKEYFEENDYKEEEFDVVLKIAKAKYEILLKKDTNKVKNKEKIYNFLITKGYNYGIIKSVLEVVVE